MSQGQDEPKKSLEELKKAQDEIKQLLTLYRFQPLPVSGAGAPPSVPIAQLGKDEQKCFARFRVYAVENLVPAMIKGIHVILMEVSETSGDMRVSWIPQGKDIPRLQVDTKVAAVFTPGIPPSLVVNGVPTSDFPEHRMAKLKFCTVGAFYYGFRPQPGADDDLQQTHEFAVFSRRKLEEYDRLNKKS